VSAGGDGTGRSGGFLAFWTTLPGILTGVAAVVTAIVGLVTIVQSGSNGGSAPAAQTAAVTSPAATTGLAATTGASTPAGVLAHGRLSMNRDDSADLEQGVIVNSATSDVTFGPESTPYLHSAIDAFLAPVQAPATKSACTHALTARHDAFEALPQLDTKWICVSTTEGHVAVVHIVGVPGVGSAQLVIDYIVWS
jgi:hypothetical protein